MDTHACLNCHHVNCWDWVHVNTFIDSSHIMMPKDPMKAIAELLSHYKKARCSQSDSWMITVSVASSCSNRDSNPLSLIGLFTKGNTFTEKRQNGLTTCSWEIWLVEYFILFWRGCHVNQKLIVKGKYMHKNRLTIFSWEIWLVWESSGSFCIAAFQNWRSIYLWQQACSLSSCKI